MNRFLEIEEYMMRSREERRAHLCLNEECIEIGTDSRLCRGLLAHYLQTTVGGRKTYVCHACNNPKCSNPRHLYWGNPLDNILDQKEAGTWKSLHQRIVDKHGEEVVKEMNRAKGSIGRKAKRVKKSASQIDLQKWKLAITSNDTTKYGFIGKIAEDMNCSHTHVRRIIKKYFPEIECYHRKNRRNHGKL